MGRLCRRGTHRWLCRQSAAGRQRIVRFRVQINSTLAVGTTITNTAVVSWNDPAQTDSASVSIGVGGRRAAPISTETSGTTRT